MDKDVTKRLLRDAGLNIAPFVTSPAPTATSTASRKSAESWVCRCL
jgi:D-alanine-D-alanine ligase-like ATP-grasp enzyme